MKKRAFTLTEVLIVMGLIGFIFTLTIPNVIQKQGSLENIKKAKHNQELIQKAVNDVAALNNNKTPDEWDSVRTSENKSEAIIKELSQKLKILSYCGNSPKGCFSAKGYKTLSGRPTNVLFMDMNPNRITMEKDTKSNQVLDLENIDVNDKEQYEQWLRQQLEHTQKNNFTEASPKFSSTYVSLLEGGVMVFKTNSTYCDGVISSTDGLNRSLCGVIYVDVNGPTNPNMLGVDVFGFYLSGNSVLPMGFFGDEFSFNTNCLKDDDTNKSNGLACTAWALTNKNMDYRKCKAGEYIDWTKAARCDTTP